MTRLTIVVSLLFWSVQAFAQEDLLSLLEEEQVDEITLIEATFKGTRIINGHSIETRNAGVMDFIISHRFGTLDGGVYELFGLDNATVRLGLEYALSDRLYLGIGRSSFEKTYDGFIKYRLLRQSSGGGSPFSATLFSSASLKNLRQPEIDPTFEEKLAFTNQLLLARKFSPSLSLQIMPTWVHKNLILEEDINNDAFALGVGGRVKLSQRLALVMEYYYQVQRINEDALNAIAIGFDIETGGHVFQLQLTNATSMTPKGYVTETRNDFFDGGIHFGFNISRTFQLKE